MTEVFGLESITAAVRPESVIAAVETGFALYSQGKVIVPPVGHLNFADPPGDVHIKYGYISGDDYYVIKIASGFYDNPRSGLPSGNGSMLVYWQTTGELLAILLDRGYLTDLRTGAAGAVAAKHLAPNAVKRIGIVGTGVQARFQLDLLQYVCHCREAMVWGRDEAKLAAYKAELEASEFSIETTQNMDELAATCNLIVTATPSRQPLLKAEQIRPGTHITAIGSDDRGKQELAAGILEKADVVVADSISQCVAYGEIAHAVDAGLLAEKDVVEIGAVVDGSRPGRTSADQITIFDSTGVAIQDIQVAKMAYEALRGAKGLL
jgi:ornithine cyclodeaminase